MFYNKEFGDLKKVNYYNLSRDMADNQKSIDFLNKYRKKRKIATAIYVGVGAAAIAGVIMMFSNVNSFNDNQQTGGFVQVGTGIALGLGGYLI
ncbi:hypothetical protein ABIB40_000896 [Pedobacter sp. UYP30]|uniref:hypothetical protein n=1 Tax=Pedobacter sp. UYP30 TaxID=1756400 RepID=UPI00339B9818